MLFGITHKWLENTDDVDYPLLTVFSGKDCIVNLFHNMVVSQFQQLDIPMVCIITLIRSIPDLGRLSEGGKPDLWSCLQRPFFVFISKCLQCAFRTSFCLR